MINGLDNWSPVCVYYLYSSSNAILQCNVFHCVSHSIQYNITTYLIFYLTHTIQHLI